MSLNMSEVSEVLASDQGFEGLSNLKLLNFYDLSYDETFLLQFHFGLFQIQFSEKTN